MSNVHPLTMSLGDPPALRVSSKYTVATPPIPGKLSTCIETCEKRCGTAPGANECLKECGNTCGSGVEFPDRCIIRCKDASNVSCMNACKAEQK